MTNRIPARASPISVVELRAFRDELTRIIATIDDAVAVAGESNSLCSYNVASGFKGVKSLRAFSHALGDAVLNVRLGMPLQPGQLTERSRAHQRSKLPSPEQAAEEAKDKKARKKKPN